MADLRIDLDALHQLGDDLTTVAAEFRGANVTSDAIAEATGHDRLRDAVRDFAHGWDDTREDMVEDVEVLAEVAHGLADVFAEMDGELAAAATGEEAR